MIAEPAHQLAGARKFPRFSTPGGCGFDRACISIYKGLDPENAGDLGAVRGTFRCRFGDTKPGFSELSMVSPEVRKLDALLKHAGVEFDPFDHVPDKVGEALRRGDKAQGYNRKSCTGV